MSIPRTRGALAPLTFLAATVVALTCLAARAPQATAAAGQTASLDARIPLDSAITTGRLANGLKYYLRTNKEPQNRAELRLVVNAGSNLEEDDQRGLAHMVEHMAFNGTKHFPKQDVVAFMQAIGMQFGAHVNAYTSFDETVFQLQIPTDRPIFIDKAMQILQDWSHDVTFDPAIVDKERGVITEEWRLGLGAGERLQQKQFPVLLAGSRYADRQPIGKMDVIQNFKVERLKQFYQDWYRPDLMGIVAVGDFDKTAMENLIKQNFGSLTNPPKERPRQVFDVPDHPGTTYAVATDKEMTQTTVGIYNLLPFQVQLTNRDYRRYIVENLYGELLAARLAELGQRPDAPFLAAAANHSLLVRTKNESSLNALVKEDGIDRGLDALVTEAQRISRFGFTATELERQKQNLLRGYEQLNTEKNTHESKTLAEEYIRNFLQQEPLPGIQYEYDMHKQFLPGVTLEEINALARTWTADKSRVVVVSAPEKPGLAVPDAAKLAAVIKTAAARDTKAFVDTVSSATLMDTAPTPGAVVKTNSKSGLGLTEWELANGVKVVLMPTTFKEDEVVFRGFAPGGNSLASDQDFISAATADQVVFRGGLGKFSLNELSKVLAGKVALVQPQIGDSDQGVSGGGSRQDLETIFQLIYMTFTQPRADPDMFNLMTGQLKSVLANQTATPEFVFEQAKTAALTQNHPRARPLTADMISQMSLDKSMAFYKERFADASGFTFVFVGSFDLATMKPLVEKYLGSLPSTYKHETWKDVGIRAPRGIVTKRVEKGIEPKSQAAIIFTGPFEWDPMERIAMRAMTDMLEGALRLSLREQLGGTYSVGVTPNTTKIPRPEYSVEIEFGCAPDRTDSLIKTVFKEIEDLKANGPSQQQINDAKTLMTREFETNSKQNLYLRSQIAQKYAFGEPVEDVFTTPQLFSRLTAAMVQEAAKKYLDTNNYVQVTLFPEKK
jgi:zinc protease